MAAARVMSLMIWAASATFIPSLFFWSSPSSLSLLSFSKPPSFFSSSFSSTSFKLPMLMRFFSFSNFGALKAFVPKSAIIDSPATCWISQSPRLMLCLANEERSLRCLVLQLPPIRHQSSLLWLLSSLIQLLKVWPDSVGQLAKKSATLPAKSKSFHDFLSLQKKMRHLSMPAGRSHLWSPPGSGIPHLEFFWDSPWFDLLAPWLWRDSWSQSTSPTHVWAPRTSSSVGVDASASMWAWSRVTGISLSFTFSSLFSIKSLIYDLWVTCHSSLSPPSAFLFDTSIPRKRMGCSETYSGVDVFQVSWNFSLMASRMEWDEQMKTSST